MGTQFSNGHEKSRLLTRLMERLIYVLITSALCSVPFLFPGITVRQGTVLFFSAAMALFLILMVLGMWNSLRDYWKTTHVEKTHQ
jgi:succinate dehydrogenase hydrophobic anchor subunit